MNFNLSLLGLGYLLVLLQAGAALPWLLAFNREGLRTSRAWLFAFLGVVLFGGLLGPPLLSAIQDPSTLESLGRFYGSVLHLQLGLDLFVVILAGMLLIWPKGGAVAFAAFREGLRQPMFWLMAGLAVLMMVFSPFIPYFTFGEDHKMVQELGYDIILIAAVLFGVLAASMSIAEEIEGRTAITLMSKPVSRRQFLLGKFVGIFLAAAFLTVILGWMFVWLIEYKEWYDNVGRYDINNRSGATLPIPASLAEFLIRWSPEGEARDFLQGVGLWVIGAADTLPGLILGLCKVMVLLAISVSLATRLPMVANIVSCLVIYLLGHLTPVLIHIAKQRELDTAGTVGQMLVFMAQLFEVLLPGLELLGVGTAIVSDAPPEPIAYLWYVGSVVLYALVYTAIALLFGLILFEDRDLA